ncbi:MAG: DEAD/DEAH box helicase [Verrucomicrobiota bacterium]
MESSAFSELGLPSNLQAGIEDLGFESPSPIQEAAIPPALLGHDLVGLSETGSGKTAAFGLPALAKINVKNRSTQVLIVCPTRELAIQVCEEIHRLASRVSGLKAIPVYGGAAIDRQIQLFNRGVHLVVGTPGRLLDHIRRGSFDPSEIKMTILDEADRMLDMGFQDEMDELLAALPEERQTLFFSATMNGRVEGLINKFGNEPLTIEIERKQMTVEAIEQACYEVRNRSKIEVISRLVDIEQPKLAMVFCNTKRAVDDCTEALLARGYPTDRLHGDISQHQRERTLKRFRDGSIEVLVATDVAARGIDVDDVDLVFNYDLPQDPEDYVHRVGRTGRAGRSGKAVSFYYGRDRFRLKTIERFTSQRIPRARIPSPEEVEGHLSDQMFDLVHQRLESGEFENFEEQLESFANAGYSNTDVANCVLSMLRSGIARESESIIEDRDSGNNSRGGNRHERNDEGGERPPRNDSDMVTLFLNMGKAQGLQPKDVVGFLHNVGQLPKGSVGKVFIGHKHTRVDVTQEFAQLAIDAAKESKLRGMDFRMDFDRGPQKGGGGGGGYQRDRRGGGGRGGDRRGGGRRGERGDRRDRGRGDRDRRSSKRR